MKIVIVLISIAITLLSAESKNIYNEIGISVGVTSIDNDNSYKFNNSGIGFSYQMSRYIVSPRLDLEYVNLNNYYGVNSLFKGSLNGVYEFENRIAFFPYIIGGLGYEKVFKEIKNSFESHPFVHAGVGMGYLLENGYKAKVEGKIVQILGGNSENNEASINFGMSFPIGIRTRTVVKRRTIIKYKQVAPKKHIVRKSFKPKKQYIDKNRCPKKIDAPDRDRDGVTDMRDQCPRTPCGFIVDGYGCPIKTTLKINFATGSTRIENFSMDRVKNFANFLLTNRGSIVRIVGHTDSVGSKASNFSLSQRRAKAVANKLIVLGVSSARITSEGRGESSPIASNKTKYGKRQNRRIEAILSYPNVKR